MSSKLFVLDNFTGVSAGTPVVNHTPAYGGNVSLAGGASPLISSVARAYSGGNGSVLYGTASPSGVYSVEADVYVASGSGHDFGIKFSGYSFAYGSGQIFLSGPGTGTAVGSYTFADGKTYHFRADVGPTVNVMVNGLTVLSVTPTTAPPAGQVGFFYSSGPDTETTGFQFAALSTWYAPTPGVFDVIANADASAFIDPDTGLGEPVQYITAGGSGLNINAMVRRTAPERLSGLNQVSGNVTDVWIANDATLGVTSVQVGADRMVLSGNVGGTPKLYTVNRIVNQDAGMWHLQLL